MSSRSQKCLFSPFYDHLLFSCVHQIFFWIPIPWLHWKPLKKTEKKSVWTAQAEQKFSKFKIYKGKKCLFHIVFQKQAKSGIRKRFRATSTAVKFVGNAILGGVFFITFFLRGFLLPIFAFQKNFSWIFNLNEKRPKISKYTPTSTVFSG